MDWRTFACAAACVIACLGCSSETAWEPPAAGLITKDGAALFYIMPGRDAGIAFFHVGDLNSSASHTSNPKIRSFDYSGTLTTDDSVQVAYQLRSSDSSRIVINGVSHDLNRGRVFLISQDGNITQMPFAPLDPSEAYVKRLKGFTGANKTSGGDVQ